MNSKRQQEPKQKAEGLAPAAFPMARRRSAEPQPWRSAAVDTGLGPENANADKAAAQFSEALRRHRNGRYDEAVILYEAILSRNPGLPEVHCNLGAALAGLGRLEKAESAFRQAILFKPDYPEPYANLGMALQRLGRQDEAEAALRRALALVPRWPELRSKLGIALYQMGRLDEAETALRDAIILKPTLPEAHAYLARTLQDLCKLGEAETAFRQSIALDPQSAELYFDLGTVLMDLDRIQEAVSVYRQAIALKPDHAEAYNNLARALKSLGMPHEAEAALRRAIALRPDFAKAYSGLGNVLLELGRPVEAVANYRKAITLRPDHSESHGNIGLALMELGQLSEARQATEEAIRLSPRRAAYFNNLGKLRRFVAGESHLAAMDELARDAASLPVQDQIELHFARAKAYEDLDQYECSFGQLLAGNALKRRQIAYDETTMLDGLKRVEAVFTPEMIRARQNAGESSPIPVFVVGMLRSGTTLVEQILASHPHVFGAGELKQFGIAAADIRPPEGHAAEFPDVVSLMSGEQFHEFGARYLADLRRLAPDAARIVNKMPSNYIMAGLIHLVLPNATIIHTVRDPVDTCVSCFSKLFTEDQNHTYDLAELGRYYRQYRALMAHWHRVLPAGRILDVRYEDLVADLEGMARRIVGHCGLDWNPRCLAFHQTERPVRTASATQVRQPIYDSAIGRGRVFERFLGPLVAELASA
jgi:tetratricopeptide (TPR) repeat protein